MRISIPKQIKSVLLRLQNSGYDAFVVGGCVRDKILGTEPKDWDVTTSALPDEVKGVFDDLPVIETGIKHGTVTVLAGEEHMPIEITTFRTEFGYSDNRRPDKVEFVTDIKADLSRRDFTMNALAFDGMEESDILDVFGGISDIFRGCIRCVGDPVQRFREDALRILRALRFAAVLGFEIEENTASAIHKTKSLLKNIASERIFCEFKKLMCGCDCTRILREFRDVIAVFIPEIECMFDFPQKTKYHCYDVWEHTLHAIDGAARNPILRTAMLFHDVGKPSSRTTEIVENNIENNSEVDHFYNHAEISEQYAKTALTRLKTDNEFFNAVTCLVRAHGDTLIPSRKSVSRKLNKIGEERFRQLLCVKRADILALSPEFRAERLIELDEVVRVLSEITENKSCSCFKIEHLAIDGYDCIKLGFKGREIGSVLNKVLCAVIDEKVENNKRDILGYIDKYIKLK